jgi:hypothetical protein
MRDKDCRKNVRSRETEPGDPARLPAQVAGRWRLIKVKKCTGRKIIFCTVLTRAAKAGQNILYGHDESNEPTKGGPFHMYSISPQLLQ